MLGEPTSIVTEISAVVRNSTDIIDSSLSPTTPLPSTVISDSGANSTFFRVSDSTCLLNVLPTSSPISALLSDGTNLFSTHEGLLAFDFLPLSSRRVHLFPDSSLRASLIGIGIFTDAGFKVIYDSLSVQVINSSGIVMLQGSRDPSSKLWIFTMEPNPVISNVIQFTRHAERALFYNRCFCSCANSTMELALRSNILKIPGLPLEMYVKNLPNQISQAQGHLDRTRKGQRSTKLKLKSQHTQLSYPDVDIPLSLPADQETVIFVKDFSSVPRMHVDATGRFPIKSVRGYSYDLLFYVEASNYIHIELLRDRKASSYTAAYQRAFEFFNLHSIPIRIVRLDNEFSTPLLKLFTNLGIRLEVAPPNNHRTLHAERHIRTWKNHFISALSTCDPAFPLDAWEHLVPQAECTLNLLRPSATSPQLSAWEDVCGPYDFNAVPMAPPGTRAVILDAPEQRASWAKHGTECYYVGPAFQHYRCYTFYVPTTRSLRISDSVAWFPLPTLMPPPSPSTLAQFALDDLSIALHQLSIGTNKDAAYSVTQQMSSLLSAALSALDPNVTTTTPCLLSANPFALDDSILSTEPIASFSPPYLVDDQPAIIPRVLPPLLSTAPTSQTPVQKKTPLPPDVSLSVLPCSSKRIRTPNPRYATNAVQEEFLNQTYLDNILTQAQNQIVFDSHASIPRVESSGLVIDSLSSSSVVLDLANTIQEQNYINFVDASIASDIESPPSYSAALSGPSAPEWIAGFEQEIHRLVVKTKTGKFVSANSKPTNQRVAYARIVCRLKKRLNDLTEYRIRITYGRTTPGESSYTGDLAAYTASVATVKLLLNATVTEMAHLLTTDITDFYLGTDILSPEYMWIPFKFFTPQLVKLYDLKSLEHNGYILMELNKSIYGLPQAGILSQQKLIAHLNFHGYTECPHTPCLFQHDTRKTKFTLIVDDFAVKYDTKADANHLLSALSQLYTLRTDWDATQYVGLTISYFHGSPTLTISMPTYISSALKALGVTHIGKANTPMLAYNINYGSKKAQMAHIDTSPPLNAVRTKRLQVICGIFLYYSRTLDFRIATAVNSLSSRQSKPTEEVEQAATRLLQFLSTYSKFSITYRKSSMRLITHADASHHSKSHSRSRAGGVHYLGDTLDDTAINGPIDCYSVIIDVVCAGTFESEYAALFISCQKAVMLRNTLEDLGYPQGPTLAVSDNQCASGIATDSVTQRRSKAMDTRFHWTRDRVRQGQFIVVWRPGLKNLADIFTKALPVKEFTLAAANLSLSPSVDML